MALSFYQHFQQPIRAISFDLDDTLYYNDTVIKEAEQAQFEYLCSQVANIKENGITPWLSVKWQVLKLNPELQHDVTEWRKAAIAHGLEQYKLADKQKIELVAQAFNVFYQKRSDFKIEPKTHRVLQLLSTKYPLVAVTNGNADIEKLELAQYFVGYYRAGANGNRMKPFPDMLNMAAKQLDVPVSSILHVGDSIHSDLKSAQNAGASSCWYNPTQKPMKIGASLPNLEYSDLEDLLQLL